MKNAKTLEVKRELIDGKVVETRKTELPRYSVSVVQAEWRFEDGNVTDELCAGIGAHFCLSSWSGGINEIEVDKDSDNPMEDFKAAIKEKYPSIDFNFYFVQEYRHGGSVFHLTESSERIDAWDSGIVGFCALPKGKNPKTVANMLTDLWEGTIYQYDIYDELHQEVVDGYEYWANTNTLEEWKEFCKEAKETYGVDLEEAKEDL